MQKRTLILIKLTFLFAGILFCWFIIYQLVLEQIYPIKYEKYVSEASEKYSIDKLLIYSIIKAESNFNANAVSNSNAKGLMQVLDSTADEVLSTHNDILIKEKELTDPKQNIEIGTLYYSDLLKKYNGNMLLALAAYNAGAGHVDEWIENGVIKRDGSNIEKIPFKETNMYVRKIIKNYKIYQKLYQKN